MLDILKVGVFDSTLEFKNAERTAERIAPCYEIELYISGSGVSVVDGVEHTHQKGKLIFIRPQQRRYSKKAFTCFYIHLNIDDETARLLGNVCSVWAVPNYHAYKNYFTEIIGVYESSGQANSLLLQSKVYELLHKICSDSRYYANIISSEGYVDPRPIEKAITFIEENYRRTITLADIAAAVSLSASHLHKIFKTVTGKTPHRFVCEKRLEAAKTLLLTGSAPLEQIADETGFSSLSYFDYIFKRECGTTPTEFRKQKYTLL